MLKRFYRASIHIEKLNMAARIIFAETKTGSSNDLDAVRTDRRTAPNVRQQCPSFCGIVSLTFTVYGSANAPNSAIRRK